MKPNHTERDEGPRAVDVFAEFLEREDLGAEKFDALCAEHPELRQELERLRSNFAQLDGYLAGAASRTGARAPNDLSAILSEELDPAISIHDPGGNLVSSLAEASGERGRYRAEGEVGRGGMGAILQTWDSQLRRKIAMKVLLGSEGVGTDSSKLDPRRIRRFLEEVQITAQLDHPGVVPVHELGLDEDGCLYFTMRLVRGRDLRAIFELARKQQEGWTRSRALSAVQRVCETMAFAHEHGVIHRDLKPANVMVGSHGETYVMDWGLAKVLEESDITSSSSLASNARNPSSEEQRPAGQSVESDAAQSDALLTSEGAVIGTPTYMSPEQARGELASIGPRSDVYSVGAMLYHLLAGHPPFMDSGNSSSASVVLDRVLSGPPDSLDRIGSQVSAELSAICDRAMSRNPADRYANMGEMADDLRAYQEGRVVQAYEAGAVAEFRKWVRRNRGMAASIAAGILLAIGGLISTSIVQARSNNALAAKNDELDDARSIAVTEADRALANETVANEERQKVLRLADQDRLDELRNDAASLYPARPNKLARMELWLATAEELIGRLTQYRADLMELESGATRREREDQLINSPYRAEADLVRARLREAREMLAKKREAGTFEANGEQTLRTVAMHEDRLVELEQLALNWRPWIFENREREWVYNQLSELAQGIEELDDPVAGWRPEIRRRFNFANRVAELTLNGKAASRAWEAAIASIQNVEQSPHYRGLVIEPQIGLIPLGRSDVSGLWEFALVETGEHPQMRMDGSFELTPQTALVFVLVPGGSFQMGSIRPDAKFKLGEPYVDSASDPDEHPLSTVELDPFFISKYEISQGQWLRLTGSNPSFHSLGGINDWGENYTLSHPVESITFLEAKQALALFAMDLPTEAQWEYCARAGTTTRFWAGNDPRVLEGIGNVADLRWASAFDDTPRGFNESWSDGWVGSAPIGSFQPNPFGLYDTNGNVWEMCLDEASDYTRDRWSGTGEFASGSQYYRIVRGGSFSNSSRFQRSAERYRYVGESRAIDIGVRPVVLLK